MVSRPPGLAKRARGVDLGRQQDADHTGAAERSPRPLAEGVKFMHEGVKCMRQGVKCMHQGVKCMRQSVKYMHQGVKCMHTGERDLHKGGSAARLARGMAAVGSHQGEE